MASSPTTPRRSYSSRRRGYQSGTRSTARPSSARLSVTSPVEADATSEPPQKRRRYIPGGPGGGGRFVDEDGVVLPSAAPSTTPRPRASAPRGLSTISPAVYPRRERSTRMRTAVNREEAEEIHFSSAAAVAAAVVQSDGYKPREERGWEEFHPNLDIEATFMIFRAEDVDGTSKSAALTPAVMRSLTPVGDASTPTKQAAVVALGAAEVTDALAVADIAGATVQEAEVTPRRRVGRPPRDASLAFGVRPMDVGASPRVPQVLPIHNQTPKERLDLKLPTFRKTDRILLFENTQSRYVEKSMMNVGYQESDDYIRPARNLIKATDLDMDDEMFMLSGSEDENDEVQRASTTVGRVEYDMDEQDDKWLAALNVQRKAAELGDITREIFEITITKIEKEWHALEKRIPKPNPKPPQTHRPRSSSAAAVNGEPQAGEEQDSKCAICDDGDCENTNAIVFCDGCDLAVHQECYGVPFIPEGQWLCRKCQLIGRGIPTCIFCPNTDGAFKQTNSSKWAHLLCAMWIPEVSLGNHTFMEPVQEVEKVPRNRWKLTCYICNQRMGACIQCGNKACYQAFHVTCARRAHLYLKMKNSQGALAFLDGNMVLKAFCDKHCPQDYAKENSVGAATKAAKKFYRRTMKGRIWADSQASALAIAASQRHSASGHAAIGSLPSAGQIDSLAPGGSGVAETNKKGQPAKLPWKLPTGAPVVPQAVYDVVESAMQRFTIRKRKEFIGEACRYWTLKREARRGAALLKRLQLQMETFSSMELTRRNFAAMGPSGKARLSRRIDFAEALIKDLEQLKHLTEDVVKREQQKLEEAEIEADFVDTSYFPIHKLLPPVMEKAYMYDNKDIFKDGFAKVQKKLEERYYTTTLAFAHDLCEAINVGINTASRASITSAQSQADMQISPSKGGQGEAGVKKRLAKRIFQYVKPALLAALRAERDVSKKNIDTLVKELDGMIEASLEVRQPSITVSSAGVDMIPDAPEDTIAEAQVVADPNADFVTGDATEAGPATGQSSDGVDAQPGDAIMAEPSHPLSTADHEDMDVDAHANQTAQAPDRVKVELVTSPIKASMPVNGLPSASASVVGEGDPEAAEEASAMKATVTPAASSATAFPPPNEATAATVPVVQINGSSALPPLTPPQSHGSLNFSHAQPLEASAGDVLSEGGIPWYLKSFELRGTTAVEEKWQGRDALRSLSEELTDMDDEDLKDLGFDVDDEGGTIMAVSAHDGEVERQEDDVEEEVEVTPRGSRRTKADAPAVLSRKTRSGQLASGHARKGLRSAGRRR